MNNQLANKSQTVGQYLTHVDGLRGVAVLSVIFFHLNIELFGGGYTGVDIFFVISGFLITSQLQENIKKNCFSFSGFYLKRIRRLLPAFLFMLCMTLFAGYLFFPFANFERLGHTSIFSLFSLSNVWFWSESGYFDASTLQKPLLHTWSLSVEEQFYFVWPSFLLLLKKSRCTPLIISFFAVLSLLSAEYWLRKDSTLVFYLTPFRMVEFSLGGLVYWLGVYKFRRGLWRELISVAGLLFVGVPLFFYNANMVFPGFSALLPCIGAAMLIHSGAGTFSGTLLENRAIVFIGLISYSLYLVHWPIIVFFNYSFCCVKGAQGALYIFMASLFLAIFMYYFIEAPFRKKVDKSYVLSNRFVGVILGSIFLLLVVFSLYTIKTEGKIGRSNLQQLSQVDIENGKSRRFSILQEICSSRGWSECEKPSINKSKNVLILGDSHAVDGLNILYQAYPKYHYVVKSLPGCPPIVAADAGILSAVHPNREKCILLNEERLSELVLNDYDFVVISVYFDWYDAVHLSHAVEQIKNHSSAKIIVFGNYLVLNVDMPDLYSRNIDPRGRGGFLESLALYDDELSSLADERYYFISKRELLCTENNVSTCSIFSKKSPFTYDKHHLSREISTELAKKILKRHKGLFNEL